MRKIELLAPAGNRASFLAGIAGGADAVYLGGPKFGARAWAENCSEEELLAIIDYAHLHGRKVYLTVNTLIKDDEIDELYDYILPLYQQGLDAVIVQDLGVLQYLKEHFLDLPIHCSTQMSIGSSLGVEFLRGQGAKRVVLARELSLEEVEEICSSTDMEIECFVHGALCYSYSGQCLMSSMIGGRSGNRGQCAQTCRLPFQIKNKKGYFLSLKDICTIEHIPALIQAGVHSFKIEGRMKNPAYVALVTDMYRKYIDLYWQSLASESVVFRVDEKDRLKLMDIYNRGGFSSGYYYPLGYEERLAFEKANHVGVPAIKVQGQKETKVFAKALLDLHKGDILEIGNQSADKYNAYTLGKDTAKGQELVLNVSLKTKCKAGTIINRTRNERLIQEIQQRILVRKPKVRISGILKLKVGKPACLEVNGICYFSVAVVEKAKKQALQAEKVQAQMRKTGNTEFEFTELVLDMDEGIFMPVKVLNELRRSALEGLEKKICERYRREIPAKAKMGDVVSERKKIEACMSKRLHAPSWSTTFCHVSVENKEQLVALLPYTEIKRLYIHGSLLEERRLLKEFRERGCEIFLALSHVCRQSTMNDYKNKLFAYNQKQCDGFLLRTVEEYQLLRNLAITNCLLDANLYVFNQYAKKFWQKKGVYDFTVPLELNQHELKRLDTVGMEMIVYGYLPLMITDNCNAAILQGCEQKESILFLKDRTGTEFPVKNYCDFCYNVIYNTLPLCLFEQLDVGVKNRLSFTIESGKEVIRVMECYLQKCNIKEKFTKGHLKRGIR